MKRMIPLKRCLLAVLALWAMQVCRALQWRVLDTLTRTAFVLAVLLTSATAKASDGFHARVQVTADTLGSADQALVAEVQRYMIRGLEEIDGVVTASKEPDFFISVISRTVPLKEGEIVILAATVYGVVPEGSAEALLKGELTRERIEDIQRFLNALVTIGPTILTAGGRDQVSSMCLELVADINRGPLAKAREYPVGGRDAFKNFALRMGAREVISPPASRSDTPTPEYIEALQQMAAQGDSAAQADLGYMYFAGWGVPQNYIKAIGLLKPAAAHGQPKGMMFLGGMYTLGAGVLRDRIQGYMWLILAAANAPGEQAAEYAKMRDDAAARMTPEEVLRAQRLASDWKPLPR